MCSSNLVATYNDMGICLNENSLWQPHYDTSAIGAHCKKFNIVHTLETYTFYTLIIMIKIMEFFVEFFLDRMQECILGAESI